MVATGHNLDDEAATLFGSVMHWRTDALPRQSPALASTHPKLVRRVKPLYRLSERETAAYAFLRKIDYIVEECPFAKGATSIAHKEVARPAGGGLARGQAQLPVRLPGAGPAGLRAGRERRAQRVHSLRSGDHRDALRVLQARRSGQAVRLNGGPRNGPPYPPASERPGGAVALLCERARAGAPIWPSNLHGGPDMAPKPPAFGASRRSRAAPLESARTGPDMAPPNPSARHAPGNRGAPQSACAADHRSAACRFSVPR